MKPEIKIASTNVNIFALVKHVRTASKMLLTFVLSLVITVGTAVMTPSTAAANSISPDGKCYYPGTSTLMRWNVGGRSGGCTCQVAQRLYEARGVEIPWKNDPRPSDASTWWDRASEYGTSRDTQKPTVYSIAAFGTHVAFVESINPDGWTSEQIGWWKNSRGQYVPLMFVREWHNVTISEQDYSRPQLRIYGETIRSYVGYSKADGIVLSAKVWTTPRTGIAGTYGGLKGFIKP